MTARRVAWSTTKTVVSMLTLWLLVIGCAGQQEEGGSGEAPEEEEKKKGAPPVAGSFVGEAPDASAFLALVADVPEGEGDEREVKAYLCDGQTVSDWFVGSVVGNDLSLSSDSGAQLEGELTPDAATGTITDPNGNPISFEAPLATGIAGLYNVDISSDGTLSGTSQTGGQLEGQLGNILEETSTYPVRGTITPPNGQPQDFSALTSPNTSDQHRWIILADGRIKGGNVGSHFEFNGFVFEQRFDCDFDDFDDFDFNHCDFNFNQFVFVEHFDDFDFDRDFDDFDRDDFDHDFDFDRGRDQVGGTFGQVGDGGQDGGGKGKGGKDQGGDGGGVQNEVRMGPIPETPPDVQDGSAKDGSAKNGSVQQEGEAAKKLE
jgi:hypothetical protein